MVRSIKSSVLLSAAVAALPAFVVMSWCSPAKAQYQVQTGHVTDANPRVGSGGFNGNTTDHNNYNVNNNIVTGNVSGLNYFHDNRTGEFDSHTFAGNTGSSSFDQFNNTAAPVNYGARGTGQPNYTTVYNSGNFVGQQPGSYIATPGGTNYIPAPRIDPLTPLNDSRLELTNTDPARGNLLVPGQLNVAGPVDPSSGSQSIYNLSPLYGVRQSDGSQPQDPFFNSRTSNSRMMTPADRAKMTPGEIQKMRDELNTTVIQPNDAGQTDPASQTPGAVNLNNSQQLTNPTAKPDALASGQINSAITSSQLGSGLNSGQGMQNTLLVAPNKQSKQLQALEEKYAKDKQQKLGDLQATERFNAETRAQKNPTQTFDASKSGKTNTPGGIDFTKEGGVGHTPVTGGTGTNTPAVKPTPKPVQPTQAVTADRHDYIVTSLATGIDAKGLAQLMKTAEEQMRQGKFTEAVDTYDTAQEVAPNNPFVALGRGFAEMGASYYGKADIDISRAIAADPAILAGRYDLKGFLGEDRLKFVHDDLEDIANHEKSARPLVLLSYVAHNGGDDATAARDLEEASRRGGYTDLVKTLREAWNLK